MVKASWGNVKVINDKGGRWLRAVPRKKYTRTHPYPEHTMHFKPLPREKPAIIIMKRHGNRINHIAKALGRSTNYVWRVLHNAYLRGTLHKDDKRKMEGKTRLRMANFYWRKLQKFMHAWEKWILGEGDKPP
jgi:hypothetical protein